MQALLEHAYSYKPMPVLHRWYLCEALVIHFMELVDLGVLISLRKYFKGKQQLSTCTQWPIARIIDTHQGRDCLVHIVTFKQRMVCI